MKFALTVFASRQVVNHGHILVNGKVIDIPSYQVKDGDEIALVPKMRDNANVLASAASSERRVPDYVEVDHRDMKGRFIHAPRLADVPYPVQMEPHLVVEFYSR
jgi:small subunit ribosomal protein S4